MFAAAAFVSTAVLMAASIPTTDAHGYILVPASQFKGGENSAWLVQIDPVWESEDWYGNTAKSVEVFNSLKAEHNYKDLKTLLDDTSLYGPDCGWTNPNGTPQPIPTDGKAVFSRGLIHTGPCEIWLDSKKVMASDDCYSEYGHSNVNVKTEFPVDYSSCKNGGCKMMRFYWLGFQALEKKTVWQTYKDCIPLQSSGSSNSTTSQNA
ncbi:Mucin-like protein 2 [Phytophthora cinnamomi]|uniref:Mucin-like protein 2 n=1 Tax=Phytophthora cinnamomi TaxID=4785 RepID=UPI00355A39F5|nr:Mucin-like protein 2 [Phytophthora cinnamomi]